jgi:membrane carboxypeptidase/penicillin-binding protein PbpC
MIDLGKKMGITTWNNPENYGLSLTLGGADVRLLDLAQVYSTIANSGTRSNSMQSQVATIKVKTYEIKVHL